MTANNTLSPPQQEEVRRQVRELLERTDAFKDLSPDERQKVAHGLVTVVGYLADPNGGQKPLAEGMQNREQSATEKLQNRLAGAPEQANKDFRASAISQTSKEMGRLVKEIDFPKFVSGLIEGVFTSIVDSSIRQMQAYGKLLEGVVKSVEQFASDHISPNQARDFLKNKFPEALRIDTSGGAPQLSLNENLDDERMPDFQKELGLKEAPDFSSPESEAAIVRAAQLQMAKMRQQQLATMVTLGINRIVVTDGLINAKVVFDMKANDVARSRDTASSYDRKDAHTYKRDTGDWFSGDVSTESTNHNVVVTSASEDSSESKAELKAKLTGEVRVNFKSETFPLEKMASQLQMGVVQERARPE